jgi:hypothetical protein
MSKTLLKQILSASLILGVTMSANAAIMGYGSAKIANPDIIENFDSGSFASSNTTWIGDDLTVTDNGSSSGFANPSTRHGVFGLYQNGGSYGHIGVTLNSGADFGGIQFQLTNGWSANAQYVWVRALNDGLSVGDFDLDISRAGWVSILGGGIAFDEVNIWLSNNSGSRNGHAPSLYSAAHIGNIGVANVVPAPPKPAPIPAPSIISLFGLGLVGLGFARRRQS